MFTPRIFWLFFLAGELGASHHNQHAAITDVWLVTVSQLSNALFLRACPHFPHMSPEPITSNLHHTAILTTLLCKGSRTERQPARIELGAVVVFG